VPADFAVPLGHKEITFVASEGLRAPLGLANRRHGRFLSFAHNMAAHLTGQRWDSSPPGTRAARETGRAWRHRSPHHRRLAGAARIVRRRGGRH
jgi:hypothetical protein